jgi:polyisoprenyl-teichoic acid--peptidoglycan teichoic acid transferase
MKAHPKRRLFVLAAVFLVVFAAAYGAVAAGMRLSWKLLPGNGVRLPQQVAQLPLLAQPTPVSGSRINILVLGTDHWPGRPDEYTNVFPNGQDDVGHSNSIAVLSVNPDARTATILSIPRDLWVEVPDGHGNWTMDRINSAFHTGELDKLPGGGGAAAAEAVTHDFGIPIDYYAVMDFAGFMKIIDALGGVTIDVPNTFTATVVPEADTGGYDYTFFAGRQHFNGELALAYARFRYDPEGDFGRIQRQQQIALAARDKALSLGWATHALNLWNEYRQSLESDIPAYDVPGFALLAAQMQGHAIQTYSLGDTQATTAVVLAESGADVLLPDPARIADIVAQAMHDPSIGIAAYNSLQRQYPAAVTPLGTDDSGLPIVHAPQVQASQPSPNTRPAYAP